MDKLYSTFLDGSRHVISLVGAGGKSTVMYELADFLAQAGKKVLVSTTTHIFKPADGSYAADQEAVQALWDRGRYAVIGTEAAENKLTGNMPFLAQLLQEADFVLLEADGAKRHPCKVPAEHEPVLLPISDIVIGVLGMDAVGQKLHDCCFRLAEAQALLQVGADHVLTEADAAKILLSEQGTRKNVGSRKYYIILNKCDDQELLGRAECIKALLDKTIVAEENIWLRGAERSE